MKFNKVKDRISTKKNKSTFNSISLLNRNKKVNLYNINKFADNHEAAIDEEHAQLQRNHESHFLPFDPHHHGLLLLPFLYRANSQLHPRRLLFQEPPQP